MTVLLTDEQGLFCLKGTEFVVQGQDGKPRLSDDLIQALAENAARRLGGGKILQIWSDGDKHFAEIEEG